ncbi:MAG: riboflavin synthase subunit alpha, partial [Oceanobacter sp.]
GIVQTRLAVEKIQRQEGIASFELVFPDELITGLERGASVALNGTCLTVRQIEGNRITFDAIAQTLALTNLGDLNEGDEVNIERAARFGDEVGGHLLSGHVLRQLEILDRIDSENNRTLWFERPKDVSLFLLDKGYVALNGCSLTIAEVDDVGERFSVCLIPETLDVTVFGTLEKGAKVNLEVDAQTQAIVTTVQTLLKDSDNLQQILAGFKS